MSSQQNPNSSPVPTQSLSFNDISNYFSLPLQDAANNLGVCSSVLKKICRENGLDRWPYRKFLSGKSVEEIKKCAVRERTKALIGRQSGSQQQNNEMSKLLIGKPPNLQQPGSKNIQIGQPHNLLTTSLTKGITAMDEFKYGFPSDGLSTVSNKWWGGSNRDGYKGASEDVAETDEEDENHSEETPDVGANLAIGEKEKPESGKEASKTDSQGTALLTATRKRAAEEGREGLRLGIFRDYGVKKLGKKERMLLVQIFRSSWPKPWINGSS